MHKKIGVIGAGQLAQMLGEAAISLDLNLLALTSDPDACAKNTVELMMGDEYSPRSISDFSKQIDVLTFEHEHIKTNLFLNLNIPIYPNIEAIRIAQHRGLEKNFFNNLNIPTAPFIIVDSISELDAAINTIGFPCVLKTVEGGYDGKGQKVLKHAVDLNQVWAELGSQTLIIEGWIQFDRELSLVAVRDVKGEIAFYPLTENLHRNGILRVSKAPYENVPLQHLAESHLEKMLEKLDYIGILTVEFFQCGEKLIANEMAPRVHNSGHWTIEGAATSQFGNHLRAVSGNTLGATTPKGYVAMINIISAWPDIEKLKQFSFLHVHDYGKTPRIGRKLGHLTLVAKTAEERDMQLQCVLNGLEQ